MKANILDQHSVLILNGNWQPIGTKSVGEAILQLMSGPDSNNPPALALDIEYSQDVNDQHSLVYNFNEPPVSIIPVKWQDWISRPIREYDQVIRSSRLTIRAPTILVASKYKKVPLKKMSLTGRNLYERDKGICGYTGKKLTRDNSTIEHIKPLSRGGMNTWSNVILADKEINNRKGNKTLEESGLTLLHKPFEPQPKPVSEFIKDCRHNDWKWFLLHRK